MKNYLSNLQAIAAVPQSTSLASALVPSHSGDVLYSKTSIWGSILWGSYRVTRLFDPSFQQRKLQHAIENSAQCLSQELTSLEQAVAKCDHFVERRMFGMWDEGCFETVKSLGEISEKLRKARILKSSSLSGLYTRFKEVNVQNIMSQQKAEQTLAKADTCILMEAFEEGPEFRKIWPMLQKAFTKQALSTEEKTFFRHLVLFNGFFGTGEEEFWVRDPYRLCAYAAKCFFPKESKLQVAAALGNLRRELATFDNDKWIREFATIETHITAQEGDFLERYQLAEKIEERSSERSVVFRIKDHPHLEARIYKDCWERDLDVHDAVRSVPLKCLPEAHAIDPHGMWIVQESIAHLLEEHPWDFSEEKLSETDAVVLKNLGMMIHSMIQSSRNLPLFSARSFGVRLDGGVVFIGKEKADAGQDFISFFKALHKVLAFGRESFSLIDNRGGLSQYPWVQKSPSYLLVSALHKVLKSENCPISHELRQAENALKHSLESYLAGRKVNVSASTMALLKDIKEQLNEWKRRLRTIYKISDEKILDQELRTYVLQLIEKQGIVPLLHLPVFGLTITHHASKVLNLPRIFLGAIEAKEQKMLGDVEGLGRALKF